MGRIAPSLRTVWLLLVLSLPAAAQEPIILVIDTSASMRKEGRAEAARLAAALYVELAAPHGPIGVVSFDATAQVVAEPTKLEAAADVARLLAKLERLEFNGGWTEYRAGLELAQSLLGAQGGRILFLTDGDLDPSPDDVFHQTAGLHRALERVPRCAEESPAGPKVRKATYGAYAPHGACEPVWRALVEQSVAQIEDALLPRLRSRGVVLSTVALQLSNPEPLRLLRSWASQTGGSFFSADTPAALPRVFSEAFARATASSVSAVADGFEVEPGILQMQLAVVGKDAVSLELVAPDGRALDCTGQALSACYLSEGLQPRVAVARVSLPDAGRWQVRFKGKGAGPVEAVLVRRYDLAALLEVDGAQVTELHYLDENDVQKLRLKVATAAGAPLPKDATFLRDLSARLRLPAQERELALTVAGPGQFDAELPGAAAVLPPKRFLRKQPPPRRDAHPLEAELLLSGAVVARTGARLVPAQVDLAAQAHPVRYPELGQAFELVVTPSSRIPFARLAGATVRVQDGDEVLAELAHDPVRGAFVGSFARAARVSGPEKFDLHLLRADVPLGEGRLEVELEWTWLDYLLRFGPGTLGIALVGLLFAGSIGPPRFPRHLNVTVEEWVDGAWRRVGTPKRIRGGAALFKPSRRSYKAPVPSGLTMALRADRGGQVLLEKLALPDGAESSPPADELRGRPLRQPFTLKVDQDSFRVALERGRKRNG